MRMNLIHAAAFAALLVSFGASAAQAAGDAEMCESAKLKASGKYTACHLAADAKSETTGDAADYTKCNEAQGSTFEKSETKYGLDCPTQDDEATVRTDLVGLSSCVAGQIGGSGEDCGLASQKSCGNGVIDPGEVCDQGQLNGGTCAAATGGAKPLGTLACGADCAGYDTTSCVQCAASESTLEGGKCWLLAATNTPCDTACADVGLAYDSDTEAVAGSGGQLSRCSAILSRMSIGSPAAIETTTVGGAGVGCFLHLLGMHRRDTDPTTPSGVFSLGRRACACS